MVGENFIVKEKTGRIFNIEQRVLYSEFLERDVIIDVYLPALPEDAGNANLLLINDGQDLRTMNFEAMLDSLIGSKSVKQILCVGIHCGIDRIHEYGTICRSDYKGRGSKVGLYSKFILMNYCPL